jgi:hypothetical protein
VQNYSKGRTSRFESLHSDKKAELQLPDQGVRSGKKACGVAQHGWESGWVRGWETICNPLAAIDKFWTPYSMPTLKEPIILGGGGEFGREWVASPDHDWVPRLHSHSTSRKKEGRLPT